MDPEFIPGIELAEIFYWEAVRPALDRAFPGLRHSAARLDYGSDVLGFDTPQSRDHGWGPKTTLFLSAADYPHYRQRVAALLAQELPLQVRGYPTNFDQPFHGEGGMAPVSAGPIKHWVAITTIPDFFEEYIGINPLQPLTEINWLALPQQRLRTIASGRIFFDGLDQLQAARASLHWYPHDLWLYLLANQWRRIDQEEPFMARCGDVGDELGSRLVAARQIDELMRLCFLMEQQYAPYSKWFGTAFARLDCAATLLPLFQSVFDSQTWQEREHHLSAAYLVVAQLHNRLALTPFIEPEIARFFGRPYLVPHAGRYVEALHAAIKSETVRALPQHVGAIDQFVDSTDLREALAGYKKLAVLYQPDWH